MPRIRTLPIHFLVYTDDELKDSTIAEHNIDNTNYTLIMLSYLYNGDDNTYDRTLACNAIRLNALLGMNTIYLGWKQSVQPQSKHRKMAKKLTAAYEFLNNITLFMPNIDLHHTLIFMMDGTDVFFQRKYNEFSSSMLHLFFNKTSFNINNTYKYPLPLLHNTNSILYGAGIDCFPRSKGDLAWCEYEKRLGLIANSSITHPKPPLFMNSGVWIGKYYPALMKSEKLYKMYTSPEWKGTDIEDQTLVHIYMYNNETPTIELDYDSFITTSMHDVHLNNYFILDKNGWRRKDNAIYPITMHFNGYSKMHVSNFTKGVIQMLLNNQSKISGKYNINTSDGNRMYMDICHEYTQWYYT